MHHWKGNVLFIAGMFPGWTTTPCSAHCPLVSLRQSWLVTLASSSRQASKQIPNTQNWYGVILQGIFSKTKSPVLLCVLGALRMMPIKYRFLVYSSTTTCNSHAKVDLFNNCGKIVWGNLWSLWNNSIKFRFLVHSTLQYPQMHLHKIRSWNTFRNANYKLIYSCGFLWHRYCNEKTKDDKTLLFICISQKIHTILHMYHSFRWRIHKYQAHTFQRILCTRWHCPSWQYGCHIAKPLNL